MNKKISQIDKSYIYKTLCGGTINGTYETIPNIKLMLYNDYLIILGSLSKKTINYSDIKEVSRSIGEGNVGKFFARIAPTFFGGIIGSIAGSFIQVFFPFKSRIPYLEIISLLCIILVNLVFGEINIFEQIIIKYEKNGKSKEVSIYPAKINKAYDLIKSKIAH